MNYRLDIQALDEVFSQNVGGANDNIVDVLAGKSHKNSFLDGNDGIVNSFIEPCHVVIPNSYVEEVTKFFCLLEPFQMAMVQEIEGS